MTPETALRPASERRAEAIGALVYGLILLLLAALLVTQDDERPATEVTDRSAPMAVDAVRGAEHPNLPRTER